MKKVMFFHNGLTAAFIDGKQVPLLQESWFGLYVGMMAACGFDPTEFVFVMPNGIRADVFETGEGGYNWDYPVEVVQ